MSDETRGMDEELADIIRLPFMDDSAIESPADATMKRYGCRHKYVLLISESHTLECDPEKCQGCGKRLGEQMCKCPPNSFYRKPGCGAQLDPWEWISWLTRDWRSFSRRYRDAKVQADEASRRLADLLREERNAKSRLKAARARLAELPTVDDRPEAVA
ncbi:MAG: hypothetical protein M3540_12290 [Actinomycetota bacterium]|nr:hypothetical protein [Actinomycetota bacterium]